MHNFICVHSILLFVAVCGSVELNRSISNICPFYNQGFDINVKDLVGSWMTVYTQPTGIDCLIFYVRATTDLEYVVTYGNFTGRVDWNSCLLQVETPLWKHYLHGNGTNSGLLENIIIVTDNNGGYRLPNQSADQWMVFGRHGNEVLVIRDCLGETTAALARAPCWPSVLELNAIFYRSGISPLAPGSYSASLLTYHAELPHDSHRTNYTYHLNYLSDLKKKYNDLL